MLQGHLSFNSNYHHSMKINLSESFQVEEIQQVGERDQIMIFEALVSSKKPRSIMPGIDYAGDRPNLNWVAFLQHLGSRGGLQPKFHRAA